MPRTAPGGLTGDAANIYFNAHHHTEFTDPEELDERVRSLTFGYSRRIIDTVAILKAMEVVCKIRKVATDILPSTEELKSYQKIGLMESPQLTEDNIIPFSIGTPEEAETSLQTGTGS